MDETHKKQIEDMINKNRVTLFMKGTPAEPQCGFSAQVINLLNQCGAKYGTFDIFSDGEIRQGIKEYSNWPTIPQLYVDGKCVATSTTFNPKQYDLRISGPLKIGVGQHDHFNGKMKDLRIYNHALKQAEVEQVRRMGRCTDRSHSIQSRPICNDAS